MILFSANLASVLVIRLIMVGSMADKEEDLAGLLRRFPLRVN